MRQSALYLPTKREFPKDETATNAKWLIRSGFIEKEMAGVYSYLPLGLRVLRKIEKIVREEMEAIGGQEILMPALHPKHLWEKTGRWGTFEALFKVKSRYDAEYALGPTHEEIITDIVSSRTLSYKDLPFSLFQIQTKFRDEPRAKSGLLRGREFLMKDLYSFHRDEKDLNRFYQKAIAAYKKIFTRCGLDAIVVEASGGAFTREYSHEFMVKTPAGEDIIFTCSSCDFAQNREIAKVKSGDTCPHCHKDTIQEHKTVEAGNIFRLGTKFSESLGAYFSDQDGKRKPIIMGCYGIGPSRILGTIVEVHHDELGMLWPKEVAPFQVHLLKISNLKSLPRAESRGQISNLINKECEKLYKQLLAEGIEVLYDDRDASPGEKFADADLIGIPWRVVVSEKTVAAKKVEVKARDRREVRLAGLAQLLRIVRG